MWGSLLGHLRKLQAKQAGLACCAWQWPNAPSIGARPRLAQGLSRPGRAALRLGGSVSGTAGGVLQETWWVGGRGSTPLASTLPSRAYHRQRAALAAQSQSVHRAQVARLPGAFSGSTDSCRQWSSKPRQGQSNCRTQGQQLVGEHHGTWATTGLHRLASGPSACHRC